MPDSFLVMIALVLYTVDYDYPKVIAGNQTVISTTVGTRGESTQSRSHPEGSSASRTTTKQDSYTDHSPLTMGSDFIYDSPWAQLGPQYLDERNIYTIDAPPGKLGVVVDTPDEGPPVIFAIKESSPLQGKLQIRDRLLAVDHVDVTALSAVNTSRIISQRSTATDRTFTLLRVPPK